MTKETAISRVRKKAKGLFDAGIAQSEVVQKNGKITDPIPILNQDGTVNSWFVGIVALGKLAGYMQLSPDLVLMGYSTFQRNPLNLDSCPDAKTWLDKDYIMDRARTTITESDELEQPFLTYDENPTRIAWAVTATNKQGRKKTILVAGDYVFQKDR